MIREITLRLNESEIKDALTEYCQNTSGIVDDKLIVYAIEFDGKTAEVTFRERAKP